MSPGGAQFIPGVSSCYWLPGWYESGYYLLASNYRLLRSLVHLCALSTIYWSPFQPADLQSTFLIQFKSARYSRWSWSHTSVQKKGTNYDVKRRCRKKAPMTKSKGILLFASLVNMGKHYLAYQAQLWKPMSSKFIKQASYFERIYREQRDQRSKSSLLRTPYLWNCPCADQLLLWIIS